MIEVTLKNSTTLEFNGVLDRDAVPLLWEQLSSLNSRISSINAANIERIDSAGLAFLVYLVTHNKIAVSNPTPQLEMLIKLYNLESVFAS